MREKSDNGVITRRPRFNGRWWTVLSGATLLLGLTVSTAAQERKDTSLPSVEESFSSLHQALSATATNLLADAQRPRPVAVLATAGSSATGRDASPELTLRNEAKASGESKGALKRVQTLQPLIEPILREQGVPSQMAAVALVESGGRVDALSPKGARGLWQLMPETARRYGLAVTPTIDERLDPLKSTRGAARYLRELYAEFAEWRLALAAYNAGEDTVEHAIARANTRDFNSLARVGLLPVETQNYVPAVLKAIGVIRTTDAKVAPVAAMPSSPGVVVYTTDEREN
jgi:soluble lytic murein transglycosylase-like protein